MTMPMHSDKEGRYACGENYLGMPVTAYVSYDEYGGGFATHWSTLPEHRNPVRLFSEHDVKDLLAEAVAIIDDFVRSESEYMTINLLGDPEKQHNVKWARKFFKKYLTSQHGDGMNITCKKTETEVVMPSLGDKLKAQIEDREAKHIKGEHAKTVAARMKFEAGQMKARAINEEVKAAVTLAIETDTAYKPVRIGYSSVYSIHKWTQRIGQGTADYRADPHANVLDELVQWGVENGLRVTLSFDHDGVGIESWYNVVVEPL